MLRNEWLAHLDGLVVFRGLLAAEPLRSLHAALAADEDALTGAVAAFEAALFARGTNWTEALLDAVLDDFIAAREREGGKLALVIGERAESIARIAGDVRTLVPQIRAGQRLKLEARLADLSQPADPGRLEQELVIWLQKLDVDEELDRLDSHLAELRRNLKGGKEPVGRRLDFLLQEFNREANTLGSKSVDARSSNAAVELKVLIDQIREQIQNIE